MTEPAKERWWRRIRVTTLVNIVVIAALCSGPIWAGMQTNHPVIVAGVCFFVLFVLLVTLLGHFVARSIASSPYTPEIVQRVIGLLPSLAVIALLLYLGVWSPAPQSANQLWHSVSPSGKYVLDVTRDQPVWVLRISGAGDSTVTEVRTEHSSEYRMCWLWDTSDRLWFYCPYDGKVSFLELRGNAWVRTQWDGLGYSAGARMPVLPPGLRD